MYKAELYDPETDKLLGTFLSRGFLISREAPETLVSVEFDGVILTEGSDVTGLLKVLIDRVSSLKPIRLVVKLENKSEPLVDLKGPLFLLTSDSDLASMRLSISREGLEQ